MLHSQEKAVLNSSDLSIDLSAMLDFLVRLLNIPSPTGYTDEALAFVYQTFQGLNIPALSLAYTRKGALLATFKGKTSQPPKAVTAHVDTLGLMVKEIKENGRLKLTQLGTYAWNAVEFEGVTLRTAAGKLYRAAVVPVNASYHVNRKLGEIERNENTLELRLDVRTQSASETRTFGIEVGDYIFIDPRVEITDSGFIRSRHLDDKAGVAAIYGALLALKQVNRQPDQDIYFLISNYEETGHGVTSLPTDLAELLVVDMGAVGEGQTSDEFSVSICAKDTSGPYDHTMTQHLRKLAETCHIPYRMDIYPLYGSDGSMYWRSGGQARVALIGPGVDASHGYERTHQESLQHTTHLIARYLLTSAAR